MIINNEFGMMKERIIKVSRKNGIEESQKDTHDRRYGKGPPGKDFLLAWKKATLTSALAKQLLWPKNWK
jgi:hypothetical protein